VEFAAGDPAVRHGPMTAELRPFRVSLPAGADARAREVKPTSVGVWECR
jgi:hypothetical protein